LSDTFEAKPYRLRQARRILDKISRSLSHELEPSPTEFER
jgi:hypothetical protein